MVFFCFIRDPFGCVYPVSAGVAGLNPEAAGQLWRLWLPECRLSTAPGVTLVVLHLSADPAAPSINATSPK